MAKHSKGPWTVGVPMQEYNEFNTPILLSPNEHKGTIRTVAWALCDIAEVNGNAALIAAAPDLLAALKLVSAELEAEFKDDLDCVKQAQAAIAKAEGN